MPKLKKENMIIYAEEIRSMLCYFEVVTFLSVLVSGRLLGRLTRGCEGTFVEVVVIVVFVSCIFGGVSGDAVSALAGVRQASVNFVPSIDGSGWAGGPREDRSGQKRATSACRSAPCKTFGPAALMVHSHVLLNLRDVLKDYLG